MPCVAGAREHARRLGQVGVDSLGAGRGLRERDSDARLDGAAGSARSTLGSRPGRAPGA
jgi:hypothetical protein